MAEYLTKTQIGNVVDIVLHSKAHPTDTEKARRQKRAHTSLAQQARNNKASASYMALVALGNFTGRDLFVTFTYDDEHHPPNNKAVKADGERFCRRLRALWQDFGEPLKYMRAIEGLASGKRYHHHMILNCPKGADLDSLKAVLRRLWGAGAVDMERIAAKRGRTAADLCNYVWKEVREYGRPAGTKAFSCSRNLDRGTTSTILVPDNTPVERPAGVTDGATLIFDRRELLYSRYVHLRYIVPPAASVRPRKPNRKRLAPLGASRT